MPDDPDYPTSTDRADDTPQRDLHPFHYRQPFGMRRNRLGHLLKQRPLAAFIRDVLDKAD